ncbi:ATP-binding protein [Glutamicibacter sp. MNS18]|uniref:sensor histidine kinase n=1 Tax=Glutamicibacter sp. MNS18 TaxID=2989817 RepID=UPI002235982C|nr:ATP-binding protein [Glutamicibacter sp. MNS18]MCW4465438.1 ATP-binding protein [Glutamicibacter sp. MNS18]
MATKNRERIDSAVRRILGWYLATTAIVLVLVLGAVVIADWKLTRQDADRVAESVARHLAASVTETVSTTDFGDPEQIDRQRLLADLQGYFDSGMVMRLKVWKVEGESVLVVFSDEARLEGESRTFSRELAERLDAGEAVVLPVPDDIEHRFEYGTPEELRETFIGFTDRAGNAMRLEVYTPVYAREMTERSLALQLPIMFGGLLLLALVLVPLTMTLFRRLHALSAERHDALAYAETARDEERRQLARRLHDGVIQDLAGAAMVLQSAADKAATEQVDPELLRCLAGILGEDNRQLRSLLSEFYDIHVTGQTLQQALEEVATRLATGDVEITLQTQLEATPGDETAAILYRAAREFLRNALAHARPRRIGVRVTTDKTGTRLEVVDDGGGFTPHQRDRAGHIGLALVEYSVTTAGGRMEVQSAPGQGTTVTVCLPQVSR